MEEHGLCGATMATPAEHGFGPLYLTAGESGKSLHGLNPYADVGSAGYLRNFRSALVQRMHYH
jgi:hypothetical protein